MIKKYIVNQLKQGKEAMLLRIDFPDDPFTGRKARSR